MQDRSELRGRVLAVDDSPDMLLLVSTSLEAAGFEVETVDSGFAALEAVRDSCFDAVVLDVDMPGIDGLQVGREMRAGALGGSAAIAMHTSLEEDVVRARFDGYDAYLPKPCSPRELGERIARLIRARRAG
jgi:DNA-binding response OmpR family regulator